MTNAISGHYSDFKYEPAKMHRSTREPSIVKSEPISGCKAMCYIFIMYRATYGLRTLALVGRY